MTKIECRLSDEMFDKAVHGGLDDMSVLRDGGDLAIYVKKRATVNGNAAAVLTFTVELPNGGGLVRAQTVTTAALLENVLALLKGWREGGHLE